MPPLALVLQELGVGGVSGSQKFLQTQQHVCDFFLDGLPAFDGGFGGGVFAAEASGFLQQGMGQFGAFLCCLFQGCGLSDALVDGFQGSFLQFSDFVNPCLDGLQQGFLAGVFAGKGFHHHFVGAALDDQAVDDDGLALALAV